MRHFFATLIAGICLTMLFTAMVAPLAGDTTAIQTVRDFKKAVDKKDLDGMALFMAEEDESGPLKSENVEKAKASLEGLQNMWEGVTFEYGAVTEVSGKTRVDVTIAELSQHNGFFLKEFDKKWYIVDFEIFVR